MTRLGCFATAAFAKWPYAHPTLEEVAHIRSLPAGSPIRATVLRDARKRAAEAIARNATVTDHRWSSPMASSEPALSPPIGSAGKLSRVAV